MFANDIKRGYDFASKHTLCVVPAKAGIQILPRRMPQMDPRFREDDRGILGHLADFLSKENSPRSLMDRMPPSEGGDAGSIPAEGTITVWLEPILSKTAERNQTKEANLATRSFKAGHHRKVLFSF